MDPARQVTLYRISAGTGEQCSETCTCFTDPGAVAQQGGDGIFLTVEDDGIGFDKTQMDNLQGAGLANIQSRVEMLKGRMDIQSASNTGTSFCNECSININTVQ